MSLGDLTVPQGARFQSGGLLSQVPTDTSDGGCGAELMNTSTLQEAQMISDPPSWHITAECFAVVHPKHDVV